MQQFIGLARPHVALGGSSTPVVPHRAGKVEAHRRRQSREPTAEYRPGLDGSLGIRRPCRLYGRPDGTSPNNVANRFVKFALLHWLEMAMEMLATLETTSGPAAERGVREARAVRNKLHVLLSEELFREVDDLTQFPSNDQVIQRREGYRDIYQAYLLSQVAAQLSWVGGNAVYGAGQKDVATLYEYWAFLQLAVVVSTACDAGFLGSVG